MWTDIRLAQGRIDNWGKTIKGLIEQSGSQELKAMAIEKCIKTAKARMGKGKQQKPKPLDAQCMQISRNQSDLGSDIQLV